MKLQFYAVKILLKNEEESLVHFTPTKVDSIESACKICFQYISENMRVKSLGTRVAQLRKQKWLDEQLADKEGWLIPNE